MFMKIEKELPDEGEMRADKNATQSYVDSSYISLKDYYDKILSQYKEHMDRVLEDRLLYTNTRLDSIEKAIEIAKQESLLRLETATAANEHRLDILNEFRATVDDWTKRAATIDQLDGVKKETSLELEKLCQLISQLEKTHKLDYERHGNDISDLRLTRANLEGRASQTSVIIFGGIAVIGFIITLINLFYG